MIAVKAHFDGKTIVPDEPLDLAPGQALMVRIKLIKPSKKKNAQSVLDWAAEHRVADDPLPSDLSHNLDHYLYGVPKKKRPRT